VADVNGRAMLMTRFMRALSPPQEITEPADPKASAEKVAWFVSLIPYVAKNALFPGLQVI
jgi:hypothetical protein